MLILDEPTSSLDTDEVEHLFTVMRALRDDGVAILFVSHFLDQIYEMSDRMTVLRNGGLVGEFVTADLPAAELVRAMIGRVLEVLEAPRRWSSTPSVPPVPAPLLQVVGLGRKGGLDGHSTSSSTRARWWAWPGCSAPVAPSWRACSSAPTGPTSDRPAWPGSRPACAPRARPWATRIAYTSRGPQGPRAWSAT